MSVIEVKNLEISFWTNNGTVKAVRDISFNLEKGKTLAIVGESGSGKSVTAKAMLGILAGNAIIEGGEMYFDGKDLLKVPEDVFHQIRGNDIAMIFQDPLSSLNPIMKVGKQLTEAMIANNYAQRRQSKLNYENVFTGLKSYLGKAGIPSGDVSSLMDKFSKFITEGNKLEQDYNIAHDTLETVISNIEDIKIDIIERPIKEVSNKVNHLVKYINKSFNIFIIPSTDTAFVSLVSKLEEDKKDYVSSKGSEQSKKVLTDCLDAVKNAINKAFERHTPDFLAVGYYSYTKGRDSLLNKNIEALNEEAKELLDSEFNNNFSANVAKAIEFADKEVNVNRTEVIKYLKNALETSLKGDFNPNDAQRVAKESKPLVAKSINTLDTQKDSMAYTYANAIDNAVEIFTKAYKSENYSEKKKAKVRKKDRLPENLELNSLRKNIRHIAEGIVRSFERRNQGDINVNYNEKAVSLIYFIQEESARKDYKMSYSLAKSRAIDLMDEVGIPLPRYRYNQYPFELSGGMRQRIVIAIALASNPDVLICDEPTTALDVTIQAQILDLINELKVKRNISIIFITHDLGVVANMADDIAVMYAGKIVEKGEVDEVFYEPAHPYTWALLSAMPDLDTKEKLEYIPGVPPNMIYPPKGDAFAQRNKYALEIDFEMQPPMFEITPTHSAATWLLHPDAPKVEPPAIITDRIKRMHEKWGGITKDE